MGAGSYYAFILQVQILYYIFRYYRKQQSIWPNKVPVTDEEDEL